MSNTSPDNSQLNQITNPMDLMEKLTQLTQAITLQQTQMMAMQNATFNNSQRVTPPAEGLISPNPIDVKMDGTNYTFWCQAVEMYVRGRDQMRHLTGVPAPPNPSDLEFHRWEVNDVIVKGWLINSLEPRLKSKYIRHPTARDVWQALATTFYDGSDEAQVFDLNRCVSRIKQGGRAIDIYYDELHGLWQEIDFRSPNPMECARDIEKFNMFIQKTRVYTLLDGLDDRLDTIRAQVVHMTPFPSLEQAYSLIRREANRQNIMMKDGNESVQNSVAMATHSYKPRETSAGNNRFGNNFDKSKLKCSHCGRTRHLKEQCFEVVGYPEWWKDRKKRQNEGSKGRSNVAASGSNKTELMSVPEPSCSDDLVLAAGGLAAATGEGSGKGIDNTAQGKLSNSTEKNVESKLGNVFHNKTIHKINEPYASKYFRDWIVDSGATDHMTHEQNEMINKKRPHKDGIINANGKIYPVTGAGDIKLSPTLSLDNTLLVPSLSTKLISVGKLTQDLNCVALMYPTHCVF
jgi:hypothetical protein